MWERIFELEKKFAVTIDQLSKLKIEMFLIARKQSIIMNYIPEKKSILSSLQDKLKFDVSGWKNLANNLNIQRNEQSNKKN